MTDKEFVDHVEQIMLQDRIPFVGLNPRWLETNLFEACGRIRRLIEDDNTPSISEGSSE